MTKRLTLLAVFATLLTIEQARGQSEFAPCVQEIEYPSASDVDFDYTPRSYDSLFESRQYAAILLKYKSEFVDTAATPSWEDVGWVGEASYFLAEVESGNADANAFRDIPWIEEVDEDDVVGHELGHIRISIGPNIWPESVVSKYGIAALCLIERYRQNRPRFAGYLARHMATLIAMGRFEEVTVLAGSLGPDSLEGVDSVGDDLARFVERFVGYGQYEQGAQFLSALSETQIVSEDVFAFWTDLILRAVAESDLSEVRKLELQSSIRDHLPPRH